MLEVECGLSPGRGFLLYRTGWELGTEIMKIMGKLMTGRIPLYPELLSFTSYSQFNTKLFFSILKIDLGISLFKYGYIK